VSGTVGVVADMTARYTIFTQSLTTLLMPVNTALDWRIGADRARSRNSLVEASLERGSEWIMFLDDDHAFPPHLLNVLLAREKPVVAALYLQRVDPFLPIAYTAKDENGDYWPLDLSECEQHGAVPVYAAGTGGMLIRSEVFHQIPPPWFVHTTKQSEDLYFCDLLAEHEIPLVVDLDARLGHITAMNIYPDYIGEEHNRWAAAMMISPTMRVHLPINMPLTEGETEG
jgi:hypothetical protein